MTTLEQLDRLKHQLDLHRPFDPHLVRRQRSLDRTRLTYHSIALEGNTLSESETAVLLEQGLAGQGKPLQHHLEAEDHASAFDYVELLVTNVDRIRDRDLRDLHTLVCKRSGSDSAGRYRTLNRLNSNLRQVRYPDAVLMPELMTKFDLWLCAPPQKQHPIDFAAEAHFRLMMIHPFTDGNGQTARLFMNLLLLRAGYPIAVIQAQERSTYLDSLLAWHSGNDQPLKAMIRASVAASLSDMLRLLG